MATHIQVSLLQKWHLLQAVIADKELSYPAKVLAARLLDHHNTLSGRCNPSYKTLARGAGVSRRCAIKAVKELEKGGWLVVDRVTGGDPTAQRGFVTNHFRMAFHRLALPAAELQTINEHAEADPPVPLNSALDTGRQRALLPVNHYALPPVHDRALPPVNDHVLPRVNDPAPKSGKPETEKRIREKDSFPPFCEIDENFDSWWSQYPRRTGKIAAKRAYAAVLSQGLATPDELLAGTMRYACERSGENPRFTKYPAKWLTDGCWADEPSKADPHRLAGKFDGGLPMSRTGGNFIDLAVKRTF